MHLTDRQTDRELRQQYSASHYIQSQGKNVTMAEL